MAAEEGKFLRIHKFHAQNEQGATTVEAAIGVLPFLLLLLGMINITMIAFNSITLQFAVQRATRYGILGQSGTFSTRFDAIEAEVKSQARSFGIDDSDITVSICPETNPGCPGNDPGASGDFIAITASKAAKSYFGFGSFAVNARVLAKNEPF